MAFALFIAYVFIGCSSKTRSFGLFMRPQTDVWLATKICLRRKMDCVSNGRCGGAMHKSLMGHCANMRVLGRIQSGDI